MAGLMRREPHAGDMFSRFDEILDEWMRTAPFRPMNVTRWWPVDDLIRIEEFREDGELVVRAELPGIDPDKDVEVTVSEGTLNIRAERHEEHEQEEHGYLRQELRYGSLTRSLPLPGGVTEADIRASYKAGMLEIRIPEPRKVAESKIPIAKS